MDYIYFIPTPVSINKNNIIGLKKIRGKGLTTEPYVVTLKRDLANFVLGRGASCCLKIQIDLRPLSLYECSFTLVEGVS